MVYTVKQNNSGENESYELGSISSLIQEQGIVQWESQARYFDKIGLLGTTCK